MSYCPKNMPSYPSQDPHINMQHLLSDMIRMEWAVASGDYRDLAKLIKAKVKLKKMNEKLNNK